MGYVSNSVASEGATELVGVDGHAVSGGYEGAVAYCVAAEGSVAIVSIEHGRYGILVGAVGKVVSAVYLLGAYVGADSAVVEDDVVGS